MTKFQELISKFIEWGIYRLPEKARTVIPRYGFHLWARLGLRGIPVVLLRGPINESGQMGTLLVAGHEPWVSYLPGRFFVTSPEREWVGEASLRQLPSVLEGRRHSADLTIVRADRLSAETWFGEEYLAVPEWVGMHLPVHEDLDGFVRGNHSIKEDLRLTRKHKLFLRVTKGEEQFDEFYETMYLPFTKARYGPMAVIRDRPNLRRSVQEGGIIWVMRDQQALAGLGFKTADRVLHFLAIGLTPDEGPVKKRGIMAALYYYGLAHARRLKCTKINLGAVRPSLHDGLFRYKRKWGSVLCETPYSYYDLLIRWNSVNSVVRSFFSHTPLIFRDAGRLSVLHAEESQSQGASWMTGLHRLYVLNESGSRLVRDAAGSLPICVENQ